MLLGEKPEKRASGMHASREPGSEIDIMDGMEGVRHGNGGCLGVGRKSSTRQRVERRKPK